MGSLYVKSLIATGHGGLVVYLPPAWIRFNNLKPKDKVQVIANGDLVIRPLKSRDGEPVRTGLCQS